MRCTAKDGCQHHSTAVVTCISFYLIHNGEAAKPSSPSNIQISINNAVNNWSSLDGFQQDKGLSLPLLKISSELENKEAEVKTAACCLPRWAHICKCQRARGWARPRAPQISALQVERGAQGEAINVDLVPIFQGRWQIQFHRHVQIRAQNPLRNTRTSVFTKVIIIV